MMDDLHHAPSVSFAPLEDLDGDAWLHLYHGIARVLAPWCDQYEAYWLAPAISRAGTLVGSPDDRVKEIDRVFAWAREHRAPDGLDDTYIGFTFYMWSNATDGGQSVIYFGNPDGPETLRIPTDRLELVRGVLREQGLPEDLYRPAMGDSYPAYAYVAFPACFEEPAPDTRANWEAEVRREAGANHPLYGRRFDLTHLCRETGEGIVTLDPYASAPSSRGVRPVGTYVGDGYGIVQPTWSGRQEREPDRPRTVLVSSPAALVRALDAHTHGGPG
jgi:hypothetical protein